MHFSLFSSQPGDDQLLQDEVEHPFPRPWLPGTQVDNEYKLYTLYENHMATEVATDTLGGEWKGYMVLISGRNDKRGFPIIQGV